MTATADAPPTDSLAPDLFELIWKRSVEWGEWGRYDPWHDLSRRTGIDLKWHQPGPVDRFKDPWGLTNWEDLSISLQLGLSGLRLRGTLAHELAHMDRGPYPQYRGGEMTEERRVDLLASQRLIDPVVFDALMDRYDGKPSNYRIFNALQVSTSYFNIYKSWRSRVKSATAMRRWEQGRELTPWPAPWIEKYKDQAPLAAAFAGLTSEVQA